MLWFSFLLFQALRASYGAKHTIPTTTVDYETDTETLNHKYYTTRVSPISRYMDYTKIRLPYNWGTIRSTFRVRLSPYPMTLVLASRHTRFQPSTTSTTRLTYSSVKDEWPRTKDRALRGLDHTNIGDKRLMLQMTDELHRDGRQKLTLVTQTAKRFESSIGFSVGSVIGVIQARYRTMMSFWREIISKEWRWGGPPRTLLWPPWFDVHNPDQFMQQSTLYYMTVYEMILELSREICHLVQLLAEIKRERLEMPEPIPTYLPSTFLQTPFTRKIYNKYIDRDFEELSVEGIMPSDHYPEMTERFARRAEAEDEKYKSRMREQFLLRQLGMNESGHTPKPRFYKGWPVEETWDNLDYVN